MQRPTKYKRDHAKKESEVVRSETTDKESARKCERLESVSVEILARSRTLRDKMINFPFYAKSRNSSKNLPVLRFHLRGKRRPARLVKERRNAKSIAECCEIATDKMFQALNK